ncbi:class C beta-lactamase [Cupriavidus sp. USMAHM13]|uniref:Beta-lactamase n=1 Tax=Cupriavidus malaysiensis TaxID=367825 RepID=A0ABN4TTG8_9BURK|nr:MULTISPECIES: class C beta-lactamase [Cupriavidus]AOZ03661.1 class C beta-lactamase [Cupriavidus sp. USMAHM13]AOZ08975.1 class C beta-lactamase [Cupriavidus malaysiensis]
MKRWTAATLAACLVAVGTAAGTAAQAEPAPGAVPATVRQVVDDAVLPVMREYGIPGMAVGVAQAGQSHLFYYGVASRESGVPVSSRTLFELGSVSKTLTATLAEYAQQQGRLSLSDPVERYLPALRGSAFGSLRLVHLGTHTPGGLPLQVPDGIGSDAQWLDYLKRWQPEHAPGTWRTYGNPGIGTLGMAVAKALGEDFSSAMQARLLPALGLSDTFLEVPPARMADYAQGYTLDGRPIRMAPGLLAAPAYGARATAGDMLRFVQANLGTVPLDGPLQQAVTLTRTAYYQVGAMTQDLVWEQYPCPVAEATLQQGNDPANALRGTPVRELVPPRAPAQDVLVNKTGSTNGFGNYVAFVPGQRLGVVVLANRNTPSAARVGLAYRILSRLGGAAGCLRPSP